MIIRLPASGTLSALLLTGLIPCLFISFTALGATDYKQFFRKENMRIDYFHSGDAEVEAVLLDRISIYGEWAGSLKHLTDPHPYGTYTYKVYDKASGQLIFAKGFDSYFKEYQTSNEALSGQKKVFHETALIPCPSKPVYFTLEKRNKAGEFSELFRTEVDPGDITINKNEGVDPFVTVYKSHFSGNSNQKADIAIIGEGYTAREQEKFKNDLKRFTEVFLKYEPFQSYQDHFNIFGVFKPSPESGVDEPRAGIYKNTLLDASFNALGSERYLLTENNKTLRDVAAHVPYDAIYIMVNHSRYGGGGIYNFYCTFTTDNINSEYLMIHEFGHSFFGLADEYYTSSTAYNDFYTPEFEPPEPNITALKDPANIKWKHLLSPKTPVPTPWKKEEYDRQDLAWQADRKIINDSIARLQLNAAPPEKVNELRKMYDERSMARDSEAQAYLQKSKYAGKVGAFEGAGYMSKGLYRPSINCIMFTRTDHFCPVCRNAMKATIEWYSE